MGEPIKKILVAPLNWGLGHATRSMPIIEELLKQGADPVLASDGRSYDLLSMEYPELEIFRLKGYDIKYPTGGNMAAKIAKQLPGLYKAIRQEHRQVEYLVDTKQLAGIISDNRYGAWSTKVPSAFMTHQLRIKMPRHMLLLSGLVNAANKYFMGKFDQHWVPDMAGEPNLSGELSHKGNSPYVKWVGPLSRFEKLDVKTELTKLLVVLSGPEPQRSLFEDMLLPQLKEAKVHASVLLGKPEQGSELRSVGTLKIYGHLGKAELNELMCGAELVLARAGYSTIMDLAKTGKPAILIPTPGQTEQEYLAWHFHKQGIFYTQKQNNFNLKQALDDVKKFSGISLDGSDLLSRVVKDFLATCGLPRFAKEENTQDALAR